MSVTPLSAMVLQASASASVPISSTITTWGMWFSTASICKTSGKSQEASILLVVHSLTCHSAVRPPWPSPFSAAPCFSSPYSPLLCLPARNLQACTSSCYKSSDQVSIAVKTGPGRNIIKAAAAEGQDQHTLYLTSYSFRGFTRMSSNSSPSENSGGYCAS